ncbi:galactokinase [Perlabentimonas gracilis]|uniref:galactokinase n=1 Tax=Perlabentimonas gracilis TaxID=2715279 RepID=UPI001C633F93|nr:galactokinase [Perlabentimonas gracilis]
MILDKVRESFVERFGKDFRLFSAPGRINIIGEHTDYNNGFVLPAAIDKCIYLAIQPNGSEAYNIFSVDFQQATTFSVADTAEDLPHWAKFPFGVIQELKNLGHYMGGFNAVFGGDIPSGAGLSSSAALESAFAYAIRNIFNFDIDNLTLAKIGQKAEHNYVGVMCGIMDQFASIFGKQGHAILLDCRSLEYKYLPIKIDDYEFVLADTKVKHSLASSEYNRRKWNCEEGVMMLSSQMPQVRSLRDVRSKDVYPYKGILGEEVFLRCEYVTEEIERVVQAADAIDNGNLQLLGELMYQSHEGLRAKYHVSCDELDALVEATKNIEGVLGSRMMGGGFGGCTINLVRKDEVSTFKELVSTYFTNKFGYAPDFIEVNIGGGAREVVLS